MSRLNLSNMVVLGIGKDGYIIEQRIGCIVDEAYVGGLDEGSSDITMSECGRRCKTAGCGG